MKVGDVVKFNKPANPDEEKARFILVEGPNVMNRVKIQLLCDMNFKPIELVDQSEELSGGLTYRAKCLDGA